MNINDLVKESHDRAVRKGFYEDGAPSIPERLCLIHSEISEALEHYRDNQLGVFYTEGGKPDGLPIELADVVIRVADFCGAFGIDLAEAIRIKSDYNETRPRKHGRAKL